MPSDVKRFTSRRPAWGIKQIAASAAVAALTALPAAAPAMAQSAPPDVVTRAAGGDRVATAVATSRDFRTSASDVLIATAGSFPDSLAAGALAQRLRAPLLLTSGDRLATEVGDEVRRLGAQTAWLLGGEAALAAQVERDLVALGLRTYRIAGDTRYETAALLATYAGASRTGEVVLALGEHADPSRAWPDALAAGALAATPDAVPTILTRPDALPTESVWALDTLGASSVIILGGEGSIAPSVEQELQSRGYATRRIAGGSRYDTSIQLAQEAVTRFASTAQPAVFASGENFPDALAAGALAAGLGAPLLLVPSQALAPQSEQFVRDHQALLAGGVVVGGPKAAHDYVVAQLDAAVRGEPAPPPPAGPEVAEALLANPADAVVSTFDGWASWYGPGFAGRPTASGERFNPNDLTAAHRSLPFGTRVRVTNTANGLVVTVRINDRGPVSHSRVLDLSSAAADALQFKQQGTAYVHAEVLAG